MEHFQTLKASIVDLIADFQSNPFDFLYEADIQAALFALARGRFLSEKIEMTGGYHPPDCYPDGKAVRTTPVKCEYPSQHRFDIALIDRERVEPYDRARWLENKWKNDKFWGQPLCAAVEIKYMQLGDRRGHRAAGLQSDLLKLQSYSENNPKFSGIALLFVQADKQYGEDFCASMKRLDGIDAVRSGIYGGIIGPSNVSWYTK